MKSAPPLSNLRHLFLQPKMQIGRASCESRNKRDTVETTSSYLHHQQQAQGAAGQDVEDEFPEHQNFVSIVLLTWAARSRWLSFVSSGGTSSPFLRYSRSKADGLGLRRRARRRASVMASAPSAPWHRGSERLDWRGHALRSVSKPPAAS